MWSSSASVAHLLQYLTCLHSLDVTNDYLSYLCFPISLNPSENSPLTASITKRTSTHWTGSLFQATLSSPEMAVWEKPSTSAVSDILKTACLAQTSTPHSKSLQSSFFPILMLTLNFIRSSRSLVYMP